MLWILPIGGASSGRVCAYSVRSRLVFFLTMLVLQSIKMCFTGSVQNRWNKFLTQNLAFFPILTTFTKNNFWLHFCKYIFKDIFWHQCFYLTILVLQSIKMCFKDIFLGSVQNFWNKFLTQMLAFLPILTTFTKKNFDYSFASRFLKIFFDINFRQPFKRKFFLQ